MNYTFAILSFCGAFFLASASIYVFARDSENRLNRLFFTAGISMAMYDLFNFLMRTAGTDQISDFFTRFTTPLFVIFLVFLFQFCLTLARSVNTATARVLLFGNLMIAVIFSLAAVFTDAFFTMPVKTIWGFTAPVGQQYWALNIYVVLIIIVTYAVLVRAARQEKNVKQLRQIRVIMWGISIAFLIGGFFDILLVIFGYNLPSFVPFSTTLLFLFFAYTMIKYGLLVISPATMAREIIKLTPDFMVITDLNGRIQFASRSFYRSIGCSEEEVNNHFFTDYLSNNNSVKAVEEFKRKFNQGEDINNLILALKTKSEKTLFVSLDATNGVDNNGETVGCIMIMRDISSEQKMMVMQDSTIKELQQAQNRMLSILEDTAAARDDAAQKTQELKDKITELEEFHQLAVDREMKMIEMEKELDKLRQELGKRK